MILKMCARCKRPTVYPARYCSSCAPIVQKEIEEREAEQKAKSMSEYNKRRDPKYSQFYRSKAWRMLSARYLQDHTWKCESCGGLAVEVHHVIPIQTDEGWNRRFDVTNLRALCVSCHNDEHGRFKKRKRQIDSTPRTPLV